MTDERIPTAGFTYPNGDRFICTSSRPWRPGFPTPVVHPGAVEVLDRDGYPGGDIVTVRCAACGHEWEMEMPQ